MGFEGFLSHNTLSEFFSFYFFPYPIDLLLYIMVSNSCGFMESVFSHLCVSVSICVSWAFSLTLFFLFICFILSRFVCFYLNSLFFFMCLFVS